MYNVLSYNLHLLTAFLKTYLYENMNSNYHIILTP